MKFKPNNPPRAFKVGRGKPFEVKDCAHIELEPQEQITLLTETGAEYDVARTQWGFYATPSLNGRLQQFGLRGVLVKHPVSNRFYIFLVEKGKDKEFQQYLKTEGHKIVCWLDCDSELEKLDQALSGKAR